MTLIKMHFLQLLNSTYSEVSSKLLVSGGSGSSSGSKIPSSVNLSETALNALLYSKFSNLSTDTVTLLVELERRAQRNPREYGNLLQECFATWFTVRNQLLAPTLAEEVRRMDPQNTDLVKLVRGDLSC